MSKVIDGAYKGDLIVSKPCRGLTNEKRLAIASGIFSSVPLSSQTIKEWQVLSESGDKDAMSMAGRALVGNFLLGPLGLLGGAATAKSKGTAIAIEFMDGKRSLIQLDQDMFAKFQFDLSRPEPEAPPAKKRGCLSTFLLCIGIFILFFILLAIMTR